MKKDQKLPNQWCSKWSTEFLVNIVVGSIAEDSAVYKKKSDSTIRKSVRTKKVVTFLPKVADKLVQMFKEARLKVDNNNMSTAGNDRKLQSI